MLRLSASLAALTLHVPRRGGGNHSGDYVPHPPSVFLRLSLPSLSGCKCRIGS